MLLYVAFNELYVCFSSCLSLPLFPSPALKCPSHPDVTLNRGSDANYLQ